jgi:ubiquinone/menaquinone biosynthesis C-methylase UbiE
MNLKSRYYFREVPQCVMCGDASKNHKVLGQRLNQSQGFKPRAKTGVAVTVLKCSKCHLIYANPQPVPFDIQDHYGISAEDYWKPEYFQYDSGYFKQEIEQLKKLMDVKPGMKALDVGAGLGKCMISLTNAGFDAYGFEASESFHKMALEKMKIDPARLTRGVIETTNFEENYFDFITFGAVLEHLYDPAKSIEKAIKWLKPGGIIHIEIPSSVHLLAKLINLYYRMVGTNYVTNISPMHEPYHLYEFDLKSFKEHAKSSKNYTIKFHQYYVCSTAPFPTITHSFLSWIMRRTNTGMQLAVWLQKK